MGQHDYTGTTGTANHNGDTGRNGNGAAQIGNRYQGGYHGDNRRDDDRRWSGLRRTAREDDNAARRMPRDNAMGQDEQNYGRDDRREGLAIDETRNLIASSKVEGTAVYDRKGARMGTIHNFMVNKRSGRVDYAVLSFGGFMGMGTRYYPLPWDMLDYDTSLGGYMVEMNEDDLADAPSYRQGEEPDFGDRYGRYVYGYYGLPY